MTKFLDDLQRQLVAASRGLSIAQHTATGRPAKRWRSLRGSSLVLVGALVVGGTAVAATTQLTAGPRPVARDTAVTLPPGPGNLGAPHQTSSRALRAHLRPAGAEYLANVDWSSARSFAIPGTRFRGWTFEQPGKRCLAIPDPLSEGYGVTCRTPTAIAAGHATLVMLPPIAARAPNIVGVLTSGRETPFIDAPSGTTTHWERIGDLYAGTAPAGSRLVTASGRHAIDPPQSKVVHLPPKPGPMP